MQQQFIILNIKSINYLEAFQTIAYCYEKNGNYDEAERFYRKSLIKSSVITSNNQLVSSIYLHLHNIYKNRGDTILSNECLKYLDPQLASDVKESEFLAWENEQLDTIAKYNKTNNRASEIHIDVKDGVDIDETIAEKIIQSIVSGRRTG